MKRLTILTTALASGAILAPPASGEIVKAPTGASSRITVNSATLKTLKRNKITLASSGSAKRSGASLALPYSLSRWDFAAREGDVVHFKKNTGLRLKRAGGPSIAMVHPRVILDGGNGYITALISNVRLKTYTFKLSSGKVTDTPSRQRITGLKLKLTKASADFLNKGLKRKVLKSFSQFGTLDLDILKPAATPGAGGGTGGAGGSGDGSTPLSQAPGQGDNPGGTAQFGSAFLSSVPGGGSLAPSGPSVAVDANGDGQADAGVFALPLRSSTFNATTRTGTIALDGGLIVRGNGQDVVVLDDPEIVIGATPELSGLFALVNGARVQVGNVDPSTLAVAVGNNTVTVSDLDVRVSPLGAGLPGLSALVPGSPLLSLDLSLPR